MSNSPRILRRPAPSDAGAAEAPVAGHRPSANLTAGDGYEERPSRSEQRTGNKPKRLLDRKSPIQVRRNPWPGNACGAGTMLSAAGDQIMATRLWRSEL